MLRALIIVQDPAIGSTLATVLEFLEFQPVASDPSGWPAELDSHADFGFAIIGPCDDESMRRAFGELKDREPHLPVIVLRDQSSEKAPAAAAFASDAVASIDLPVRNSELQQALEQVEIYRANRNVDGAPRSLELFRNLVGSSAAVRQVRRLIEQVAGTDATVLLLGESGTGKEVVARNVHYQSKRRYKAFVPVNCGAIPSELLESELFGHEKGAFTGAISAHRGRFEMAEGVTLFLDEVGDMPLAMQVKLLRVLQERTFERVGSNRSIDANVRIVAATHNNLEESIAGGAFREDLYYRLNVFPIDMPPLRDRIEDLPLLISDLVRRIESDKRGSIRLTPAAMRELSCYRWPGNVRELANLIERLVILYPYGVVDEQDLPDKFRSHGKLRKPTTTGDLELSGAVAAQSLPREGMDLKEHLNRLERNLIVQALDDAGGVVAHAAKRLHMGRTTLVEKMRKLDIQRQEEASNS